MTIQDTLNNIDSQIARLKQQRESVMLLGDKLVGYPHQVSLSVFAEFVDFNSLTRAQTVSLISHLKSGKWNKSPSSSAPDKIDYVNETFLPNAKLRIWGAEPPASCKVVEVDVHIPAQPARIEKQRKLVCKEHELQAV